MLPETPQIKVGQHISGFHQFCAMFTAFGRKAQYKPLLIQTERFVKNAAPSDNEMERCEVAKPIFVFPFAIPWNPQGTTFYRGQNIQYNQNVNVPPASSINEQNKEHHVEYRREDITMIARELWTDCHGLLKREEVEIKNPETDVKADYRSTEMQLRFESNEVTDFFNGLNKDDIVFMVIAKQDSQMGLERMRSRIPSKLYAMSGTIVGNIMNTPLHKNNVGKKTEHVYVEIGINGFVTSMNTGNTGIGKNVIATMYMAAELTEKPLGENNQNGIASNAEGQEVAQVPGEAETATSGVKHKPVLGGNVCLAIVLKIGEKKSNKVGQNQEVVHKQYVSILDTKQPSNRNSADGGNQLEPLEVPKKLLINVGSGLLGTDMGLPNWANLLKPPRVEHILNVIRNHKRTLDTLKDRRARAPGGNPQFPRQGGNGGQNGAPPEAPQDNQNGQGMPVVGGNAGTAPAGNVAEEHVVNANQGGEKQTTGKTTKASPQSGQGEDIVSAGTSALMPNKESTEEVKELAHADSKILERHGQSVKECTQEVEEAAPADAKVLERHGQEIKECTEEVEEAAPADAKVLERHGQSVKECTEEVKEVAAADAKVLAQNIKECVEGVKNATLADEKFSKSSGQKTRARGEKRKAWAQCSTVAKKIRQA